MAAERETPTVADYVVTALSPVLIMLMVGSLVFFLVEVLYAGKYSGKLLYTLFFFVLGAVLVARISIQADAARASLYGLLLGVVTYIALLTYVEYPGGGWLTSFGWLVNLGLMLLIWWSAHKLTWDCTHIDEKRKGAGRGLLSAAGLDTDARDGVAKPETPASGGRQRPESSRTKKKRKPKPDSRLWDWIERYQKYREQRRTAPHTPGVWVIYFALAALPLFALGQSLIDPGDDQRRQATFLQMLVYVGSALALLVTTSLLGLRRYLRQRKAKIPGTMTASWLGLGAVIIVVFLVLGAFLPRPHSEVPWFGIARAGKSDREASKYAISKSGSGKGDGAAGDKAKAGDGKASGKGGQPGGGTNGQKGRGGKGQDGKGGSGQKSDQSGGDQGSPGRQTGESETKGDAKKDEDSREQGGGMGEEKEEVQDGHDGTEQNQDSQSSTQISAAVQKIVGVLKWIVFAVVVVLIVIAIALAILRYLAPFTDWAQRLLDMLRNWWTGLFGRKANGRRETAGKAEPLAPVRPPPFHAFANPFADGTAESRDPAELTRYTFLALDSWAWDRDCGRDPTETPLEFAARLAEQFPDLTEVLVRFGRLYARVSYSENPLPADTLATLEAMWEGLVYGISKSVGT